jgi:undecaprenyl-diphosphatase
MSIFDSIILGLIQGITEFAPVSSSGHLVIFNHLLGAGNVFTFDVLLNFGTLFALLIFYKKRIWSIIVRFFKPKGWVLVAKVIAATIPAVSFAVIMHDNIEMLNGWIWVVVAMQVAVGIPMIVAGNANKNADDREMEKSVGWRTALTVGLAQTLALIPGVSRSGITILTGLRMNLSAARAAEFSFLMAIPVLGGGAVKTLFSSDGIELINQNMDLFVIGNITAFIAGMFVIKFLIKWIARRGLKDFGWYRIFLAAVLTILLLTGII